MSSEKLSGGLAPSDRSRLRLRLKRSSASRAALSLRRSRTEPTTIFRALRDPSDSVSRQRKIQTLLPPLRIICFKQPFWCRVLVTEYPSYSENTDGDLSLLVHASNRPIPIAGIARVFAFRRPADELG